MRLSKYFGNSANFWLESWYEVSFYKEVQVPVTDFLFTERAAPREDFRATVS